MGVIGVIGCALSSQLSVLSSQLSVLSSQFPVLRFPFSVLRFPFPTNLLPSGLGCRFDAFYPYLWQKLCHTSDILSENWQEIDKVY